LVRQAAGILPPTPRETVQGEGVLERLQDTRVRALARDLDVPAIQRHEAVEQHCGPLLSRKEPPRPGTRCRPAGDRPGAAGRRPAALSLAPDAAVAQVPADLALLVGPGAAGPGLRRVADVEAEAGEFDRFLRLRRTAGEFPIHVLDVQVLKEDDEVGPRAPVAGLAEDDPGLLEVRAAAVGDEQRRRDLVEGLGDLEVLHVGLKAAAGLVAVLLVRVDPGRDLERLALL